MELFNAHLLDQVNNTILNGFRASCGPSLEQNLVQSTGCGAGDSLASAKTWRVFRHESTGVLMALRGVLKAKHYVLESKDPDTFEACLSHINASFRPPPE